MEEVIKNTAVKQFRKLFINYTKSLKVLAQWLIALNGSGLIAVLAFIGTSLSAKTDINLIYFKFTAVFFGIGCISAFLWFGFHLLYLKDRVDKSSAVLFGNAVILDKIIQTSDDPLREIFGRSETQTKIIDLSPISLAVSVTCYLMGMASGFYCLFQI